MRKNKAKNNSDDLPKKEKPAEEEESESEEKIEAARPRFDWRAILRRFSIQFYLGIAGGVILILVGVTGSVGFYQSLIDYAVREGILSSEDSAYVLFILTYLANGGGLTVIAGSFLLPKIRYLGSTIIRIGAGISFFALLIKIFFIGAIIQSYLPLIITTQAHVIDMFRLIFMEIGIVGSGVILAFLATFKRYRWTIILGILSFLAMIAGINSNPRIYEFVQNALSVNPSYAPYVDYVVTFLLNIGVVFFITAFLVGTIYKPFTKIIVLVCLIAMVFILISIILDITQLTAFFTINAILQYVRLGCLICVYVGGIKFLRTELKKI